MRVFCRAALAGALALAPAAALAQGAVYVQDPLVIGEPVIAPEAVIVQDPIYAPNGGIYEEDARDIAMMNGLVSIEEIDENWDGDFEVEGRDVSGRKFEITIDSSNGAVLEIDD